jgi:uncharacterized protein
MFKHLSPTTQAIIFFVITLTLAIAVAVAPIPNDPKPIVSMFAPLTAVLIMLLLVTNEGYSRAGWLSLGLHRGGFRQWPFAILVPTVVLCIAYGIAWSTGLAGIELSARFGDGNTILVIADLLIVMVIGTATFTMAEEIGWTGYLLPRLEPLGRIRAMFIRGLMHAAFHLPLIFLTTTYLAEGNKLIVVPLFVVTMTSAGFAYGYLWFSTNSVWPASLAHATHNAVWGLFQTITITTASLSAAYFVGEGGLLVALGYVLVATWVVMWARRNRVRVQQPAITPATA